MLDERQMHTHQPVAQLRVLGSAVLQRAQLEEHGARPAAVLRVVVRVSALGAGVLRAPRAAGARGASSSACRSCSLIVPPVALPRALASSPAAGLAPAGAPPAGSDPGRSGRGTLRAAPPDCPPPGGRASAESSTGCGRACSGMPSMPSGIRSAGDSRVPRSSSRTGPSSLLTPARVPRRAVCRG
ncbi:hypothetical protein SHKM778_15810 [Streptomyces sp. KM77-8]|uniref:Uncharacterized protein n=1 Tax=Streptomyces haneummycinicus TaxID=3074435 RepID=A0AAT9HD18_9ACTN